LTYYEILGVSPTASQEEIDKAYKRNALEHHPDRNPGDASAHEKFLKIQEAYDVLRDSSKRYQYDQTSKYSENGVIFDIFENENLDIRFSINFTLQDCLFANTKSLKISKKKPCGTCIGKGFTQSVTCDRCNGAGSINSSPVAFFQFRTLCGKCLGKGKIPTNKCNECHGEKYISTPEEEISYVIPKGLTDGMGLVLKGQGNIGASGRIGNLILDCRMESNQNYKVDGLNILSNLKVKYSTLLFGGKIDVQTPENETFVVEIPPKTECLHKFIVKNRGMYELKNIQNRGDLILSAVVELPKNLENKDAVKEFLLQNGL